MRRPGASLLYTVALAACASQPVPEPGPRLPALPVERVSPRAGEPRLAEPGDPRADLPEERGDRVTFTARDADVRLLIPLLAEAAGRSVVLAPGVEGRVTVTFRDVPALDALDVVLREAGLGIVVEGPPAAPFGPTVFYALPVDVDAAGPEAIAARFGVSVRLARWLVEARRTF